MGVFQTTFFVGDRSSGGLPCVWVVVLEEGGEGGEDLGRGGSRADAAGADRIDRVICE